MSMPAFDVIVCGSLHLDIMVYSPSLPRPDETVPGTRWGQQCGGKGGNQAVMSARAGARTAMIGRIGADDFGTRLIENLKAAGVDASAVLVDPTEGSGMSAAIVLDDGDYGAVIVSGANLHIPPELAGATVAGAWRRARACAAERGSRGGQYRGGESRASGRRHRRPKRGAGESHVGRTPRSGRRADREPG